MKPYTEADANVIKALAHPLRVRILSVLEQRTASPSEIAEELDASLGTVSYHVRQLAAMKLIRLVKRTPRRGAVEHHYRAEGRVHMSDAGWAQVPEIVKQAMVGAALAELAAGVNTAAGAGGFSRPEAHLSRTRMLLDEAGWRAVAKELRATVDRLDRIQEGAAKRLAKDHSDGQPGIAGLMLFEEVEAEKPAAKKGSRGRGRAGSAGRRHH